MAAVIYIYCIHLYPYIIIYMYMVQYHHFKVLKIPFNIFILFTSLGGFVGKSDRVALDSQQVLGVSWVYPPVI